MGCSPSNSDVEKVCGRGLEIQTPLDDLMSTSFEAYCGLYCLAVTHNVSSSGMSS